MRTQHAGMWWMADGNEKCLMNVPINRKCRQQTLFPDTDGGKTRLEALCLRRYGTEDCEDRRENRVYKYNTTQSLKSMKREGCQSNRANRQKTRRIARSATSVGCCCELWQSGICGASPVISIRSGRVCGLLLRDVISFSSSSG